MIYVEGIDFELAKFEYLHFAQWIEKYFYIGCEIVPTRLELKFIWTEFVWKSFWYGS